MKLINNIRQYFLPIQHILATNYFEKAKTNLVIDFGLVFILQELSSVVISIIGKNYINLYSLFFTLTISVISMFILKYTSKINLVAYILGLNITLSTISISIFNGASLDVMYMVYWLISILFVYLSIDRKSALSLMLLVMVYVCAVTYHPLNFSGQPIYFNPDYNPENALIATPVVLLIGFYFLFKLLDFYMQNQNEAISQLSKANQAKETVFSVIAHDLRSPIGSIKMANDLIKMNLADPKNDDGDSLAYAQMIDTYCAKGLAIITDVLEASENLANLEPIEKQSIELNSFVKDLIQGEQALANKKKIKVNFTPFDYEVNVQINKVKFSRAINNLISNAIKFSNPNNTVDVSVSFYNPETFLIKVKDNGIGIPADIQPYVFDKFTSAGRRGTSGEKSVGLGMSITKKIVELHLGKIWFETSESGTTFYVAVPL